jgi:glycosidase
LFEKLPIFWAIAERRKEFPEFYKKMMALRRGSVALRRGTLEWLKNSDESRVVTFVRRAGNEEVLVAINFSSRPFFGTVEVSNGMKRVEGLPVLSLDAWGYRVFRQD